MKFAVIERLRRSTSMLVIFVLVAMLGAGCTKKESASTITLATDWSALVKSHAKMRAEQHSSGAGTLAIFSVISRVMINVSASDMANPVVFIWDLKSTGYQGSGNPPAPPTSFQLEVPRGSNRLIQVLAIVEEVNTEAGYGGGPKTFYYGDLSKSIASADEGAPIALTRQSIVAGGDGSISGRYYNADGSTPTGVVNMYYSPPGKPRMIVEKTGIFSGYFQFFMLPGVPFSYRLDSGEWLMENVLPSNLAPLHSSRVMSVLVPPGYRQRNNARYLQEQRVKFVGFFGPGAGVSARQVCYQYVSGSIANLFTSSATTDQTLVPWQPLSVLATAARVGGGGVGTSTGTCANGTSGVDQFGVALDSLAYGDSPIGIRGPFVEFVPPGTNYKTSLSGTHSNGSVTLAWKFLNGVVGNSVDGVAIFARVVPATESMPNWHDSAPCNELVSRHGFTEVTRIAAGTPAAPIETGVVSGVTAASYASGRHVSVVCPYKNNRLYDYAISHYNNSGISGGEPPATKILALPATATTETSAGSRYPVVENTCTAIRLVTVDANGNHARRQGGSNNVITVSVVDAPSSVKLYYDTECTDPAGGDSTLQIQINSGPEKWFSVKADASIVSYDLSAVDTSSGGTLLQSSSFFASKTMSSVPTHVSTELPSVLHAHQCYPLHYVRGRNSGANFVGEVGAGGSIDHAVGAGNYQIYSSENCMGASEASVPFSGSMSWSRSYIKFTTAGTFTITPNLGSLSGGLTPISKIVTVLAAPIATHFRILGLASNLQTGLCHEAWIVGYNGSMRAVVPTSVSFSPTFTTSTLSANNSTGALGFGFHVGGTCSSLLASPTIPLNTVEVPVRFQWMSDPNGTILEIRLNPPANYLQDVQPAYSLFN